MNFEKGVAQYKEGNFEAALTTFNELITQDTENPTLFLYRGRILTRLGKGMEALADFDILIQLEPYNTDYISDRGVVLHLLGRNEEALEELDRAANLDPKNPYRYSSRAYLKDRIGDLMGAIADYEKAIELDPEDAVAYNNLGLVEEKMGRKEKAQQHFNRADSLTGYPPKKETGQILTTSANSGEKRSENQQAPTTKAPNLTLGHYVAVLKGIFTEPNTRKEFAVFLTRMFVKKRTKSS